MAFTCIYIMHTYLYLLGICKSCLCWSCTSCIRFSSFFDGNPPVWSALSILMLSFSKKENNIHISFIKHVWMDHRLHNWGPNAFSKVSFDYSNAIIFRKTSWIHLSFDFTSVFKLGFFCIFQHISVDGFGKNASKCLCFKQKNFRPCLDGTGSAWSQYQIE